jgi:hypothetical protein
MPLQCEIGVTLWSHSNTSPSSTLKRPEFNSVFRPAYLEGWIRKTFFNRRQRREQRWHFLCFLRSLLCNIFEEFCLAPDARRHGRNRFAAG